jgi:hypothetical protein
MHLALVTAAFLPALLILLTAAPSRALAAPASAAGSASTRDGIGSSWHPLVGDVVVDTLDVAAASAFTAGRWVLLKDAWSLDRSDSLGGRLVTAWKPVKHPLVRLVSGAAQVRVSVALRAVGEDRTEVRVQGGIATQSDLNGTPIEGMARAAGERECRGYVTEVRQRLEDQYREGALVRATAR